MRTYELLEDEIDAAVLRAVPGSAATPPELIQSIRNIPSNPERRVKQAIHLAQRVAELEKHCDQLQTQLKAAQSSAEDAGKEVCE